ncbi:MAG: hypothetical protein M3P06_11465 [Acidobacteriota bacterium]|nr:hypothetical protein [Acidobacteriota bacterium]
MSTYVFTLDGLAFASDARFFRGPAIYHQPQIWAKQKFIGHTGVDATGMQFLGLESQEWKCGKGARFTTAEKDKLVSVYNGRIPVVWKTPQDATGINVVLLDLVVEDQEPGPSGLFLCTFTLVRRA